MTAAPIKTKRPTGGANSEGRAARAAISQTFGLGTGAATSPKSHKQDQRNLVQERGKHAMYAHASLQYYAKEPEKVNTWYC